MPKNAFKNPQFAMVDPVQQFEKTISLRILNYYIHSITLAWRARALAPRQCSGEGLREFCVKCCALPEACRQEKKPQQNRKFQWRPKSQILQKEPFEVKLIKY